MRCSCASLVEPLRVNNRPTEAFPPIWHTRYGTSACLTPKAFFAVRVALAVSWAAVVAWSLGDWVHGYEIGYWFTKLTHWSAVLQLAYHAVAVYTTGVVVLRASSEAGARTNPSFVVATLVLQSVMLPISFMVCLLYWTLGFGGTLHALSNFTHGVNFVAMAFDGLINRQPADAERGEGETGSKGATWAPHSRRDPARAAARGAPVARV
ncbi:hypothetical protein KFE25_005460 [Diacronema lutheri]|uniref:Uncharacterized protein n=1 Tax=Diacronema lutheri TaxID=2081491 RepID=A0A8J6CDH9_DIALT|nr:hypothetical protein KFE25_005460 [Diacronema lutheri]